jgi:mitochondrial enoyl-[acyl-carrier protein] reductase / trans-2-enoyl-CoA reductase
MATQKLTRASRSILASTPLQPLINLPSPQAPPSLPGQPTRVLPLDRRRFISTYGYTQSKALIYSSYGEPREKLHLHGYSISPPTSTSVTLRMLAAPINPADVNQIQGSYPTKPPFTNSLGAQEPSAVGGNEGVAEVIAAGGSAKTLSKGDWVIMKKTGMGTWRTHMQVDESEVTKVDKSGLTTLQVGTVGVNPVTAYRMLKDYVAWDFGRNEEWFIQNGANSGVGRAAIQLGREWGLKSINVIRERPGWQDLKAELEGLGATKVVTESELMEGSFREKVKEWTNGGREPIRLALNCVGGKPATSLSKVLSPDAYMVTYGAMSKQPTTLPTSLLIFKNISFTGFWVSKWSDKHPREKQQTVEDVLRMTREGRFKDVPVEEVKWAWETGEDELKKTVQGTLEGYRKGKGVFVFAET